MKPVADYINKVKTKSTPEREVLAFGWAAGLTVLVAGLWVVNMVYLQVAPKPQVAAKKGPTVWQALTANAVLVGEGFGVVKDDFRAMIKLTK